MTRKAAKRVAAFCKTRCPQSDEEFLCELNLIDDADGRVALAVRRAVAKTGQVDPIYIRPDDREQVELACLPLWDSMDWVALVMAIEDELGINIPDEEAMNIRITNFSVRQCITDTRAIAERIERKPSDQ